MRIGTSSVRRRLAGEVEGRVWPGIMTSSNDQVEVEGGQALAGPRRYYCPPW